MDILFVLMGLRRHEVAPRPWYFFDLFGDIYGRAGEQAWAPVIHVHFDETQFHHIAAEMEQFFVAFSQFAISFQESESRWKSEIVIQIEQDGLLHLQDLLFREGLICYINEIFDVWWIYLFIFGGYQHSCDTDELVFAPWDLHKFCVPVYQFDRYIECLRQQFEILMNINQPIYHYLSHPEVYFLLAVQTS